MSAAQGSDAREPRVEWVSIDTLEFDPLNPRLEDEDRGASQDQLATILDELYDSMEIAASIANFGYFESEVVIGIAGLGDKIVIVEGNRRLAAVKGIARPSIRAQYSDAAKWQRVAETAVAKGNVPERIPVLVEPNRSAVIATIGYRHISGIEPWEPYQQARYIADRIDADGFAPKEVAELTGITETNVRSKYRNYGIVKAAEAAGIDPALIQESFGVWDAALGRVPIRQFIGAPDPSQVRPREPVLAPDKQDQLKELISWLFGPTKKIKESRDLGTLADVLANPVGLAALRDGLTLQEALQATRQPKSPHARVVQFLTTASSALKGATSVVADAEEDTEVNGDDLRTDSQVIVLLDEIEQSLESMRQPGVGL